MKLVRENINEVFKEESDPIEDMGIGLYVHRDFNTWLELDKWIVDHLHQILETREIPEDIIRSADNWFPHKYDQKIGDFITKYITVKGNPQTAFSWYRSGIQALLKDKGFKVHK